ncbi:uncharacterized protein yae1 [Agrilus planipennis]|uniref:Uncharacterized protein yae1 n=1 Tax=Agrilus planipennis TaxID=224129 RepID=A0A1W4XH75_AGRPL|nr:uncharacterized protein yae1 [Agrilus planipennis]
MEDIEKDWNKIAKSSKKTGYRDGVSDGRESNYQKYFDGGYEEGLKNGLILGKIKGIVSITALLNKKPLDLTEELQNTRYGCCEICKNKELLNNSKDKVINIQSASMTKTVTDLMSSYTCIPDLLNKPNMT